MIERLVNEIEEKFEALTEELSDPAVFNDPSRVAEVSKARSDLEDAHRRSRKIHGMTRTPSSRSGREPAGTRRLCSPLSSSA